MEVFAASVIAVVGPYVAAGATKAAEVLGGEIAKQTGVLFSRLRDWLAGDEEAEAVLDQFEKKPSRYGGALEEILIEKASAEPARAKELEGLVDAMGPRIDVLQKIRVLAGQAVGFDVDKWERGVAKVEQDVGTVERGATLTGVRLRRDP